jgi:Ulp1 family protease
MSSKLFGGETMAVDNIDLGQLNIWHNGDLRLNDNIINFYLALIAERENTGGKMRVLIHSTGFWRRLTRPRYNYQKVSRLSWRKGASGSSILDLDYIIIPIDGGKNHWTLGVINFKEKRFEYYDSFTDNSDRRKFCFTVGAP